MKNMKPQSSIFEQALSEAVMDFAQEMGYKSAGKNETVSIGIASRKTVTGAIIRKMTKQNIADETSDVRMA